MILAKYVAGYSWLAMDAFFDVVANLVPRGKEFPFCMALAYSSSIVKSCLSSASYK